MSSRRGSAAVPTAGPSRSDSPLSPTAAPHDDDGGADEGAVKMGASRRRALQTPAGVMESGESSRGSSVLTNSSYIQRIPQLDIAFLHAVSTHRPLGPHKHFNLIPILMTLDRTARQVGADIRDGSASADNSPVPLPEEELSRRSRSISRRMSTTAIKREDGEDVERDARLLSEPPLLSAHIDAGMVWQRLEELYDVEGLEDLEYQSIEADDKSPLSSVPRPSFVSVASRKALGNSLTEVPAVFGFGSPLYKFADDKAKPTNGAGSAVSKRKTKAAAAKAAAYIDDDDDVQHAVEFELGPWDEFEGLIAPRRLESYAPDERGHISESDGELSELEDEAEASSGKKANEEGSIEEAEDKDGEEGGEAEEEEDGEDEDADEAEEEEEEDEDEEEDEEEEEDEDEGEGDGRSTGKRKGGASNAKAASAAQRQKRNSATGTASPVASAKRASRSSAASTQPRRSARR